MRMKVVMCDDMSDCGRIIILNPVRSNFISGLTRNASDYYQPSAKVACSQNCYFKEHMHQDITIDFLETESCKIRTGIQIFLSMTIFRRNNGRFYCRLRGKAGPFVDFMLKCLQCALWCFEKFIKFINQNAYIMTGKLEHWEFPFMICISTWMIFYFQVILLLT